MAPNFLTSTENATLKRLESEIKAGQKTFVQVGLALSEIRDSKLYRGEFKTFDEYCQTRWGWKRQRAYELIQAAEVQSALPVECNNIITNDSQARELAQVPTAARADVLKEVAASGPVTAKAIKEAAKRNAEPEEERPRVTCGAPPTVNLDDEETRAHRITRAVMEAAEGLEKFLSGINATPKEIIQAATSLHGRARRLESNAAKLEA
ncbi:MAG: hypothetical protein EBS05_10220 [Proteobacteria bacterium]|nr:hypothetical protein [Pseudomonadota bacterium]NDD38981.1 hypothetical protein [Verrucomicrobiota bacterium]NDE99048.1 hypothetical protein [Verrucomicrobiota bacterium]